MTSACFSEGDVCFFYSFCWVLGVAPVDHDWKKGGQRKGKLSIFLPLKLYFPVVI